MRFEYCVAKNKIVISGILFAECQKIRLLRSEQPYQVYIKIFFTFPSEIYPWQRRLFARRPLPE